MINDEKNIDRLYQEQFKDFEATPESHIWDNIEAKLDEEKNRKVILFPLWLKLAGIAAVALIALGIFSILNNNSTTANQELNNVVTIPTKKDHNSKSENHENKNTTISSKPATHNAIVKTAKDLQKSNIKQNQQEGSESIKTPQSTTGITTVAKKNSKEPLKKGEQNTSEELSQKQLAMQRSNPRFLTSDNKTSDHLKILKNDIALNENLNNKTIDSIINDSTSLATTTLDDILNEEKSEEDKEKENTIAKKWIISPNMAPVYYNSLSKGSPISNDFSSNEKSGKVNMSYGINVGIQLNKKLSIRSGINKVQYGYNTNNVYYSNNTTARFAGAEDQNSNINYSNSGEVVLLSANNMPEYTIASIESNNYSSKQNGTLIQNIDYLEVPFELQYNLIDKKFGLHITGGFSTLLLNNNEILLQTYDDMITDIGEANNINDVNFSTNIGVGMNYNFTKNLLLNVEPMFKYQLNAFSNNNGFNPYSLGIYTGFSFRF